MKATKYDPRNNDFELCLFEQWDKKENRMGHCGLKAVGIFRKTPLCEGHFGYAITQDKADVVTERLNQREGLFRYGK